jgi:acetolactate synthase-1/2/3 large subunit
LIEWKQETEFGKHVDLSFENPDFMMLADAFGWRGLRADNARDLRDTLEVAFDSGRPALVVVPAGRRWSSCPSTTAKTSSSPNGWGI